MMMLLDLGRSTADISVLVALSFRISTLFAPLSTSVAISSAMSANNCRSVRVSSEDLPFYRRGNFSHPFHQRPVVNGWHA